MILSQKGETCRTIESLGHHLTKIFDPFTRESGWIFDTSGFSENQLQHLDVIYDYIKSKELEPNYEPFTNRTPLVCPNLESGIGSICNPCGIMCGDSFEYCPDSYCAFGCADRDVGDRLTSYYEASSPEHQIDFNFCHPIWKQHYIEIRPPSQEHKLRYIAIGSTAASINLISLSAGFYFFYLLAREKGMIDEIVTVYGSSATTAKVKVFFKYFIILIPFMAQAMDSLLDASYFIKLQTELRIIHVDPIIHVIQALLLFTCKRPRVYSQA